MCVSFCETNKDEIDVEMEEENANVGTVAFGPLNQADAVLEEVREQQRRILFEIREELFEAHSHGNQQAIEYWEAQEEWWLNAV